jgi:hypothetical protein
MPHNNSFNPPPKEEPNGELMTGKKVVMVSILALLGGYMLYLLYKATRGDN